MPEILEVELYRGLAEKALERTIDKVWMVDAPLRTGRDDAPWAAACAGRPHVHRGARAAGKLMLLDADDGPTLGVRFGMTGGLVVDGDQALDRLLLRPGGLRRASGCGPA